MTNVLLGVTGSVAAIRTPALCAALRAAGHSVKVVATASAEYFFDPATLEADEFVRDADEWPGRSQGKRWVRGEGVLHIELRRWADVLLIAPLDANTLAKLALGLSDNCLTCVHRAWSPDRPVILAPAMNTLMWESRITARHLRTLWSDHADIGALEPAPSHDPAEWVKRINGSCRHLRIVGPVSKTLACGDEGMGAMAEVGELAAATAAASAGG